MSTESNRSYALDALRGFAILTMILSSRIPYGVLPGWMYHVQVPPPKHVFDPLIPGISWVDLVFPFFLFSMGAAFPFAMGRRLDEGYSKIRLTGQILFRGIQLMFFALVIQHIRPNVIDPSLKPGTLLLSLCLFGFLFLLFLRYPKSTSKKFQYILKGLGLFGLLAFMAFFTYPDGTGFSFRRYDIIILVLSNVAIVGSIIWMLTPGNFTARIAILAILFAIRLSYNSGDNFISAIGNAYPSWSLFQLYFLKYLFIVIPGTIIGDLLRSWLNSPKHSSPVVKKETYILLSASMFFFNVLALSGLYSRLVFETIIITLLLGLIVLLILNKEKTPFSDFLLSLYKWGFYWFILGLLLDPYEGGIKKDHSTMSYYFVTSGLAIFMIIGFTIIIDGFQKKRWLNVLIDNGQNPMLAYAGGTNLLTPLVMLTYIDSFLTMVFHTPWLGVIKGIIVTGILALIVNIFTRNKIFWRT